MSTCSNCYNGCTEIVSDRCVKYTGIDVPVLGIQTGDSLSFVEQALITFLVSTLDGTGIKIDLGSTVVCNLVQKYLPTCGDLTIVDISKALIQAACDLQVQVTANTNAITTLNANYTIGCLTGVTSSSDTHTIVQAVINKLCTVDTGLTNLTTELHTMYSSNGTELNNYISSFLASQPSTNSASARMIPYAPIPYFGPISNYPATGDSFDVSGAGQNYWAKVYLCNGANPGVPDLRGWTLVGVTTGMGGGILNPIVDPNIVGSGNPNYTIIGPNSLHGSTTVTLGIGEIPNHTHPNTATTAIIDPGHTHTGNFNGPYFGAPIGGGFDGGDNAFRSTPFTTNSSGPNGTGITAITTMTNAGMGSGGAHSNVQPSKGCYYIIYIP